MMRNIDTFCGSIIDCPTTVVVNSSNTGVALGSGVSKAIREACGGDVFQKVCHETLEEQFDGGLPQGQVLITNGGASRYRWILHAATMDFKKGRFTSQTVVRNCMLNSLKASETLIDQENLDNLSLGVPLFGTDVGGLSIQEACDAMCEGMKIYFRGYRDSQINEIRFVHPKEQTVRQVDMILARHFVLG